MTMTFTDRLADLYDERQRLDERVTNHRLRVESFAGGVDEQVEPSRTRWVATLNEERDHLAAAEDQLAAVEREIAEVELAEKEVAAAPPTLEVRRAELALAVAEGDESAVDELAEVERELVAERLTAERAESADIARARRAEEEEAVRAAASRAELEHLIADQRVALVEAAEDVERDVSTLVASMQRFRDFDSTLAAAAGRGGIAYNSTADLMVRWAANQLALSLPEWLARRFGGVNGTHESIAEHCRRNAPSDPKEAA